MKMVKAVLKAWFIAGELLQRIKTHSQNHGSIWTQDSIVLFCCSWFRRLMWQFTRQFGQCKNLVYNALQFWSRSNWILDIKPLSMNATIHISTIITVNDSFGFLFSALFLNYENLRTKHYFKLAADNKKCSLKLFNRKQRAEQQSLSPNLEVFQALHQRGVNF